MASSLSICLDPRPPSLPLPLPSLVVASSFHQNPKIHQEPEKEYYRYAAIYKRRTILTLNLTLSLILPLSVPVANRAQEEEVKFQEYVDPKERFRLLVPSSYVKIDKAGATVLFEDMNNGFNNVGVVVSPVRLTRISDFGTPQFVADKLIQAEKRKESTKDVELIAARERSGRQNEVYEFEYKIDSTRGGMKKILSAAFVAEKKLYLLNISLSYKTETETPIDKSNTTTNDNKSNSIFEHVLHSFDVSKEAT